MVVDRAIMRPQDDVERALAPQAANVVGLIDQTDLFDIMARALDVD